MSKKPNRPLQIIMGIVLALGIIGVSADLISNRQAIKNFENNGVGIQTMQAFNDQMASVILDVVHDVQQILANTNNTGSVINVSGIHQQIVKTQAQIQLEISQIKDLPVNSNQIGKKNQVITSLISTYDTLNTLNSDLTTNKDIEKDRMQLQNDLQQIEATHGIGDDVRP